MKNLQKFWNFGINRCNTNFLLLCNKKISKNLYYMQVNRFGAVSIKFFKICVFSLPPPNSTSSSCLQRYLRFSFSFSDFDKDSKNFFRVCHASGWVRPVFRGGKLSLVVTTVVLVHLRDSTELYETVIMHFFLIIAPLCSRQFN